MDITKSFAEFITGFTPKQITAENLNVAKASIKDTVGVMLMSANHPVVNSLTHYVNVMGGNPQAHILCQKQKTSILNAGFVNAAMAHCNDFDDYCSFGHAGVILVPTILALGEFLSLPGKVLLESFIVGFEIGARLGSCIGKKHYQKGWHTTATVGTMAATACACYLMRLDEITIRHAFGIAAAQSAGLQANFGTDTKVLYPANAVRNALSAVYLAKQGITSSLNIFDDQRGFFSVFGDVDTNFDDLIAGLGQLPLQLQKEALLIKKWPCCFGLNACIRLAKSIKQGHQFSINDIESIKYSAKHAAGFLNRSNIQNESEARFSLQYLIIAAILYDEIDESCFEEEAIKQILSSALFDCVNLEPECKRDGYSLEIILKNGQKLEAYIDNINHGLVGDEIDQKFRVNAMAALAAENADKLLKLLDELERLDSLEGVIGLLV